MAGTHRDEGHRPGGEDTHLDVHTDDSDVTPLGWLPGPSNGRTLEFKHQNPSNIGGVAVTNLDLPSPKVGEKSRSYMANSQQDDRPMTLLSHVVQE